MGRVLLARDLTRSDRPLALKILLPEYRNSIAGFLTEFVTQRSFHHPNIPAVHELGFAQHPRGGEVPYFTLEYCRGIPLILAIHRLTRLDQAWPWMLQVLRAMGYIHDQGWLHRDLKPGNVLVDLDARGDTSAHLIDLGVASRLSDPPEEMFIGTPEYCSPEVLSGYPFDQRADLYAFGLVLYEVIARKRPWAGSDEQVLLDARLESPPPPLTHPECPEGVKRLIGDLLQPSPRKRPKTAEEVIARLCEATGMEAPIETSEAFERRLQGFPFEGRDDLLRFGEQCLTGVERGRTDDSGFPRAVLLSGQRGYDTAWLAHELADRGCVGGARVVRLALDRRDRKALAALQPALDVFRRLREERGERIPPDLQGPAVAGMMLTRLHDVTVVVIEGLQRADAISLEVLKAAFTGSKAPNLRLLATVDPDEEPLARGAFEQFSGSRFVYRAQVPVLSLKDTASWIEGCLGRGVLELPLITRLHGVSGGTPAGLRAALHDLFRRGVIRRSVQGYEVAGDPRSVLTPMSVDDVTEVEGLLGCLRHAVPVDVVERYLDQHATHIRSLLGDGTLVQRADGRLVVGDEHWRRSIYHALPAVMKMRRHRRLARALHAARSFPNQRSMVAIELMHSDKPVLAAPHLVVAASEASGADTAAQARQYLDRAEDLLRRHVTDDEQDGAWRWWIMLWKARVRLAMADGDIDGLERASEALVELATDAAHIPTLGFALETRMVAAFERSDWAGLPRHAESRLALDGASPGSDARGLRHWAEALRLHAFGETEGALEQLEAGLAIGPARPRPGVLLRLATARADFVTRLEWVRAAHDAVKSLQTIASQAGDGVQALRASILDASLLRLAGLPEHALNALRLVARQMPPDHLRRCSSLLELELGRLHADFGWNESARDHAGQAKALAERDGDAVTAAMAQLIDARTWRLAGRPDRANDVLEKVLAETRDLDAWRPVAEARELQLQVTLDTGGATDLAACRESAMALGQEAARRMAWPLAGRFLALASIAASRQGDAADAIELAERALREAGKRPGWEARTHWLLFVLAAARRGARNHRGAETLEHQAMEQLRRLASGIEDDTQRKSWLSTPENSQVLGVASTTPDT